MTWWLVAFVREGSAAYLSHLDTTRALQRIFARAGIELARSQGMRPKACISLPLPLPVGASGCDELAVVEVVDASIAPATAVAKLDAVAPPGIVPVGVTVVGERHPRPRAKRAEYTCHVRGDATALGSAVARFAHEPQVIRERVSPKGRRSLDLKEYVADTRVGPTADGVTLDFAIRHRATGAARPQEYIDLIAEWAEVEPVMHHLRRTRITWENLPPATTVGAEGVGACDADEESVDR